jgi:hypothetical protein
VFFDPQQNIYGGSAWEALGLRTAPLAYNCRNTQRIARYAYGLVGAETKLRAGTPEGVEVSVEQCTGEREMLDAVRRALHRIVVEGRLSPDRLVVLSPHSTRTSAVWRTQNFGNLALVQYPASPGPGRVQFANLAGVQGTGGRCHSSARRAKRISTRRSSTSMWRRQGRGMCSRWPSTRPPKAEAAPARLPFTPNAAQCWVRGDRYTSHQAPTCEHYWSGDLHE